MTDPWVECPVCGDDGRESSVRARVAGLLDPVYRERNEVVAALLRSNDWVTARVPTPEEGWWIVYAETECGQVSWHVSIRDIGLFLDVPVADSYPWDGHTTPEKYARLARLGR
jgi:hypothetical protein